MERHDRSVIDGMNEVAEALSLRAARHHLRNGDDTNASRPAGDRRCRHPRDQTNLHIGAGRAAVTRRNIGGTDRSYTSATRSRLAPRAESTSCRRRSARARRGRRCVGRRVLAGQLVRADRGEARECRHHQRRDAEDVGHRRFGDRQQNDADEQARDRDARGPCRSWRIGTGCGLLSADRGRVEAAGETEPEQQARGWETG